MAAVKKKFSPLLSKSRTFMKRFLSFVKGDRLHRSFTLTRRRDYVQPNHLPGYLSFAKDVVSQLRLHRSTFGLLLVTYAIIMFILGGVTSQDTYVQIADLFKQSSGSEYVMNNSLIQGGLVLGATFLSGPTTLTIDQQIYLSFALLLAWLTTVWLHREYMLGRRPKLRDGLYNSGAPVVSSLAIILYASLQLVPAGIAALAYASLTSVGILSEGFSMMLFSLFAIAVAVLTLYWLTSTIIALVVVTLPGVYPFDAIRAAREIVLGRRIAIALRLLWAQGAAMVVWLVIFIPLILLQSALSENMDWLDSVPILPLVAAALSAGTVIWTGSYAYLLYRRLVDAAAK